MYTLLFQKTIRTKSAKQIHLNDITWVAERPLILKCPTPPTLNIPSMAHYDSLGLLNIGEWGGSISAEGDYLSSYSEIRPLQEVHTTLMQESLPRRWHSAGLSSLGSPWSCFFELAEA